MQSQLLWPGLLNSSAVPYDSGPVCLEVFSLHSLELESVTVPFRNSWTAACELCPDLPALIPVTENSEKSDTEPPEWCCIKPVQIHGLAQREGEWGHVYLSEILQKHFLSVLLTEFSISGAEWGKWSQHTSRSILEIVNPCEIRSLMQGSNCESNLRSSQRFGDYCDLEVFGSLCTVLPSILMI